MKRVQELALWLVLGAAAFIVGCGAAGSTNSTSKSTGDVNSPSLHITTDSLPNAQAQAPYTANVQATGGTTPYSWKVNKGNWPEGIILNSSTGTVAGSPGQSGRFTVTLSATDSSSTPQTTTQTLSLTVSTSQVAITTTSLPSGAVSVAYTATLAAANGVAPYTWSMAGGQLPSGLSLTGVGVLGGTPTQAGSFSFSAGVKDSNGSTATANLSVSIAAPSTPVINGISPPSGPISGGTAVTVSGSNFASGASVTFGGTAAASVVVSSSSQIQVVTPNHVAGNIGIIVSANGQSSSSSANFTYTAPNNGPTAGGAPAPPSSSLSIAVSGNRLVSGSGAPIRLLGVNVQAPWVGNSGPISSFWQTQGSILATYNANVVRIPLDEDCWLNINGQASQDGGSSCSAYPSDVLAMVNGLHAAGLYAILDLQFTGPGSTPSTNNGTPMPDADHATAFWQSVATTFKDDPAVLFDLFNEPTAGTWSCWLNGCDTGSYNVVGFQSLINTVRAAGATTQPIMLGGLDYSNDLSEWLANEPSDSSKSLVASFHNYGDNSCNNTSCWASTVETTNSSVPVVTGEFGEGVNGAVNCAHTFVDSWMSWADGFQISYLAWWYDGHGQAPCSEQTLDLFQLWPTPGNNYLTPYGADIMGHMQTQ